jgi:hypothetical protein
MLFQSPKEWKLIKNLVFNFKQKIECEKCSKNFHKIFFFPFSSLLSNQKIFKQVSTPPPTKNSALKYIVTENIFTKRKSMLVGSIQ